MNTSEQLIAHLGLHQHPEGGYYKETYRSDLSVTRADGANRALSTLIYFLMPHSKFSKFHRIQSDELWMYQDGEAITIYMIFPDGNLEIKEVGKDISSGQQLQLIIPAGVIFGAEVKQANGFNLSACMVSPGFDFMDFELFKSVDLIALYPQHAQIIQHIHQHE